MKVDEILSDPVKFSRNIFDTSLKKNCMEIILKTGLPKDQASRLIPPNLSTFIFRQQLSDQDTKILMSNSQISHLNIGETENQFSSELIRELLKFHVQVLTLENCTIPSKLIGTRDLMSIQYSLSKLKTLIIKDIYVSMHDEKFINAIGSLMEVIVYLRFGTVSSCDSIHQTDEIFTLLARDHLSKNRFLTHIDLRGSDIDIMATRSRRNILINFPAEMRRWARRLRSLAFDSDANVCRILRILNRQCFLLKSLCLRVKGEQTVSNYFDNLKLSLQKTDFKFLKVEPFSKLTRLCLNGHFRITDSILKVILPSLSSLEYLNIAGCPVNFEQYWNYLPESLQELIVDECNRSQFITENRYFLKQVLKKCKGLKIYVAPPIFEGEDFECFKGLAILNGGNSLLSDQFNVIEQQPDDDLIAFELKVEEMKNSSNCFILF